MTTKRCDYIIIYCFLSASILCIAIAARLFVIKKLEMDEFSGLVAFSVTCLLLSGAYLSFQSILSELLLPIVERIFRKEQQECPASTVEFASIPEPIEVAIPNYADYKISAQQKIQQEQAETLERVIEYTGQQLVLYMKESQLNQLYEHIRMFQYATEDECKEIQDPVKVDSQIKPIDVMHFGWNIGNQFKKSGIETATFIKNVFTETIDKVEISTLKRKLRVEGTCRIKLTEDID